MLNDTSAQPLDNLMIDQPIRRVQKMRDLLAYLSYIWYLMFLLQFMEKKWFVVLRKLVSLISIKLGKYKIVPNFIE